MLTTSEVAHLLGVHPTTVRWWSDRGIIRVYRITRRGDRRFRQEDIEHFLAELNVNTDNEVKTSSAWR